MIRKVTKVFAASCRLLLTAGALAGLSAQASFAADALKLKLDWLPSGYHAPIFYGVEKGYYKEAGIDLTIEDGQGTNPALQAAAAGNADIVMANYSTMIQSVAAGMDLVGVAGLIQKLPDSLISLKDNPLKSPKDLEGKTIAITPDSASAKLFDAYMAAAGVDASKVTKINMKAGQDIQALLSGNADAMTGWIFTQVPTVASKAEIAKPLMISDEGINILGTGFVTTKSYEKSHQDLIKRFVAATAKSYADGFKNPEEAVDAMLKARPLVEKGISVESLKLLEPLMHSARSEGKPFGWTDQADWEQSEDLLQKYFDMQGKVDVSTVYTNDYIAMN
ncbi:ABC transporter substrate-binding protein [Rhizobium halophytocola]|uniref:Thiamine pyrimidine synthase n=1 Tax=Rhizobium halophytocola TaxID=735519 RepID=A0ABS4DU37_9HYPH|nr:ABC transporter substrate-binding protein [Rhizobium halophytocola]MBP1849201.1 NitT/TauT family transport system substrate-binding protein [Rhizobium halophytocola]